MQRPRRAVRRRTSQATRTPEGYKIIAIEVRGIIHHFNFQDGHGLIRRTDTQEDVFVHHSGISHNNPQQYLSKAGEGAMVEFDLVEGQQGLQAANVKVMARGPKYNPVIFSEPKQDSMEDSYEKQLKAIKQQHEQKLIKQKMISIRQREEQEAKHTKEREEQKATSRRERKTQEAKYMNQLEELKATSRRGHEKLEAKHMTDLEELKAVSRREHEQLEARFWKDIEEQKATNQRIQEEQKVEFLNQLKELEATSRREDEELKADFWKMVDEQKTLFQKENTSKNLWMCVAGGLCVVVGFMAAKYLTK